MPALLRLARRRRPPGTAISGRLFMNFRAWFLRETVNFLNFTPDFGLRAPLPCPSPLKRAGPNIFALSR